MNVNDVPHDALTTPREIIAALRRPGRAYVTSNTLGGVSVEVVKADAIAELQQWPLDQPLADDQYALAFDDGTVAL